MWEIPRSQNCFYNTLFWVRSVNLIVRAQKKLVKSEKENIMEQKIQIGFTKGITNVKYV